MPTDEGDFYKLYFDYIGKTEAPKIFHRWCAVGAVAALLGRQCYLPFGAWTIYPNMYILLMGSAGARKGTAMKFAKAMCKAQGYDRWNATRASKERFLMDMCKVDFDNVETDDLLELKIDEPSELFVMADEFTGFTGINNLSFLLDLAEIWDCPDTFSQPKIHGKSVVVTEPTLNILSASQPEMIATAFPPEAIGQGSMSRLILVHGEPTGEKITIPQAPTEETVRTLTERVRQIRASVKGQFILDSEASLTLDRVYKEYTDLDDFRFKHYNTRRLTHILKLAMVFCAFRLSLTITEEDVLRANTLLHYTEMRMPKALGEFGKSRHADITNKVLEVIKEAKLPVTSKYIWKRISQDVEREEQLREILKNLVITEKIHTKVIQEKQGFMIKNSSIREWPEELMAQGFLTAEELF